MKQEWVCKLDGQEHGPLSFDELKQLAAEGKLSPQSEVRRTRDQRWFKATQIPGLYAAAAKPADASTPLAGSTAGVKPIKKAKPLAAPVTASPAVAPPAIPRGTPLAPQGLPVGVAVPPPLPPPQQQPVKVAPAAASMAFVPQIVSDVVDPAAKRAPHRASAADAPGKATPHKKQDRSLLVVAGLGGTCVLVAVLGGLLMYVGGQRARQAEVEPAAVAAVVAPSAEGEANPAGVAEANPTPTSGAVPVALASATSGAVPAAIAEASSAPPSAQSSPLLAKIRSISQWSPLSLPHQFSSRSTRVTIVAAWLAADESGRRVAVKPATSAAALPAASAEPAPAIEPAADAAATAGEESPVPASPALVPAEPAKYLFVEVKIANLSPKPLSYQGWNATGDGAAILAGGDAIMALVPTTVTPSAARLMASEIPVGGNASDVLVFALPAELPGSLRLALPQTSLLANARGFCAVEVSPTALLAQPAAALAGDPVMGALRGPSDDLRLQIERDTARLQAEAAAATPQAAAAESAALAKDAAKDEAAKSEPAKPAASSEMKKDDRPPTIDELNKQIEELDRKAAEAAKAAAKGADAKPEQDDATPSEPKPGDAKTEPAEPANPK